MKEIKNIHQRRLAVMADVQYVQKTDKGKGSKGLPYNFVTHDEVTGKLHPAFVKHGIDCTTDIQEITITGNMILLKVLVSFINVDDPKNRIEVNAYGIGLGQLDKAIGIAESYATKFAYLKNFMLETGEDAEKSNVEYKSSEPINISQLQQINGLLSTLSPKFKSIIMKKLGVTSIDLIPNDKFEVVIQYLNDKIIENGEKQ